MGGEGGGGTTHVSDVQTFRLSCPQPVVASLSQQLPTSASVHSRRPSSSHSCAAIGKVVTPDEPEATRGGLLDMRATETFRMDGPHV